LNEKFFLRRISSFLKRRESRFPLKCDLAGVASEPLVPKYKSPPPVPDEDRGSR
ncbi:hypothetical protein JOB18_038870, partial [Solea senegalensis]